MKAVQFFHMWLFIFEKQLVYKGQMIWKANCRAANSSKKRTNEFIFTSMWHVFIRFLEEIEDTSKSFQNNLTFSYFIYNRLLIDLKHQSFKKAKSHVYWSRLQMIIWPSGCSGFFLKISEYIRKQSNSSNNSAQVLYWYM